VVEECLREEGAGDMKCVVCGREGAMKCDLVNFPDELVSVLLFEPLYFCSGECFEVWRSFVKKLCDSE
jgi:hypothetical protein